MFDGIAPRISAALYFRPKRALARRILRSLKLAYCLSVVSRNVDVGRPLVFISQEVRVTVAVVAVIFVQLQDVKEDAQYTQGIRKKKCIRLVVALCSVRVAIVIG